MDTPISAAGQTHTPARVGPPARNRGRTARRLWTGGAAVLAALLLGATAMRMGWAGWPWGGAARGSALYEVRPMNLSITLTESGEIKPRESIEIKCELEGQATILKIVPESTRVQKGDLLVELASDALTERLEQEQIELQGVESELRRALEDLDIQRNQNASDIRKAEIDQEVARLDLEKYLEGDYKQKLKGVEIDIQQAELDVERKREELLKNQELLERGFVTPAKIKQLDFELKKALMTLERHQLALATLVEYELRKERMQRQSTLDRATEELERVRKQAESREKQAEARVRQLEATLAMRQGRVRRLTEQLAKCKIYAPADGIVQYPNDFRGWDETRITEGAKVFEGQKLLVLPDTSRMLVSTRIHEADRHRVREGMPCVVRVPAVPGKTFTGKISKIAQFADSANRWLNPELKEHATEILLDETDAPLSPGDSAEIEILIETIPDALAVPVQSVHARGRRSFVFVQNRGSPDPVQVKLGRSNTTAVEILEGLSPGDRVLIHADERLLARLPTMPENPEATEAADARPESPGPQRRGRRGPDAPAAARPPSTGGPG